MSAAPDTAEVGTVHPSGFTGLARKGEVWKVAHQRKGTLSLRLTDDVDTRPDAMEWGEGEIVEGQARYISDSYRLAQMLDGLGTRGEMLPFRVSLCRFLERVS